MSTKEETLGFQTEVKKLLDIVVHSLYSNKEIFLRELISNASDALDKMRFIALSNGSLYENDSDLKITIDINPKLKTLHIKDNGIGMSRDEAIENLGTIAKSGTEEFLSKLSQEESQKSDLIGQFGVGFYSAFIVADKVTVKSRRAGLKPEEGIIWQSEADGNFTIANEKIAQRGTEIILHLKEDQQSLLNDWTIRGIVTKYSEHICWPIFMKKNEANTSEDEENKEAKEKKAQTPEYEQVNKATALWTIAKSEISDDDYKALYKHISHDFEEPLLWSHNQVEGKHEYVSLLYVPAHAPFDLWQQESKHGLKLYIKRVFIMDDVDQFLPRYLRFVKGIIDANDLPLNVSREILQDNQQVDSIRSASVKRVLSMLEKLADSDQEKYQKFWNEFGLVLKEGPVEDFTNKEKIANLLRFSTTHDDEAEQKISLKEYVSRMGEGQDKIYYISASSHNAAKNSPHLEIFRKKGIEVLLLSDKIDEWLVGYMSEFDGKKLQSISKGKVDLDDEVSSEIKEKEKEFEPVLKHIEKVLAEKVKKVQVTNRLTNSPACIVADEQDMGLEMQRILKAAGQDIPASKPVFEINPEHKLIKQLYNIQDDKTFEEWSLMLFEQAVLAEGGQLDNPADFIGRVNALLSTHLEN